MREIGYNSQDNNVNFGRKFMGWSQCFSTSAWMFMSYYSPLIVSNDDAALSIYVDDVESQVGKPGIAEKVKQRFTHITGYTSLWWAVQEAGITKWLNEKGVSGKAIFKDLVHTPEELDSLLEEGPVIIGTMKLGGLKGGHIVLIVDSTEDSYIVNDPFGNATTKYVNKDGHMVRYSKEHFHEFIKLKGNKTRVIYWG